MRAMTLVLLLAAGWLLAAADADAQAPIRIGFISPLTGAIAAAGKDMYSGCELYWQESYTGARIINEAVRAIGGKVEDRAALMAALRKVEITDAPRGPVQMDAYGNPTQNIYIRKVQRVGGKLQNTVIYTYPAVSQFWKYNPEEFLKQPVYSRDFPPCRHC
jgi:branched-chain amino acid transport system substrate-binding protein